MSLRVLLAIVLVFTLRLTTSDALTMDPDWPHPPSVLLKTEVGDIAIRLDWANAPENCAAFMRYVQSGVYAHTSFDDLDGFCLYGGKPSARAPGVAPNGNMIAGAGPPGEFKLLNRQGAVGFRRTAGDCNPTKRSNCTQIYIMRVDHPQADGDFSVFGTTEAAQPVIDTITARLLKHEPVPFNVELPAQ